MSYQVEISSQCMALQFFHGWKIGDVCITDGIRKRIQSMPEDTWFMENVLLAHAKKMSGNPELTYDNAQDIVLEFNGDQTINYYFIANQKIKVVTNSVRSHTVIYLNDDDYEHMSVQADLAHDTLLQQFIPDFMKLLSHDAIDLGDGALEYFHQIISEYVDYAECELSEAIAILSRSPFYEVGNIYEYFEEPAEDIASVRKYANGYRRYPEVCLCDLVNSAVYGHGEEWWHMKRVVGKDASTTVN